MFFKRKTRNRRLNSGTVLDVKLRSDQVRATRSRENTLENRECSLDFLRGGGLAE